jgi:transcriptional regulator GlxA family with amidase domain
MMRMRFAQFIYDGVEPVEMAIYGVLSMARRIAPQIQMFTVAPRAGVIELANGLRVLADHAMRDCPDADVLIVCGGPGWTREAANPETLQFLRTFRPRKALASVCTGGMILAATGLLDGRRATTKRDGFEGEKSPLALMKENYPGVSVVEARLVDEGSVITGGGVTLCIDSTLHLLRRFVGEDVAAKTAKAMAYSHAWEANRLALGEWVGV